MADPLRGGLARRLSHSRRFHDLVIRDNQVWDPRRDPLLPGRSPHCGRRRARLIHPGYAQGREHPNAFRIYSGELDVVATVLLTEQAAAELRESLDGMPPGRSGGS